VKERKKHTNYKTCNLSDLSNDSDAEIVIITTIEVIITIIILSDKSDGRK
jgi:hypothetical protein